MHAEGMERRRDEASIPCIMPDILAKPQVTDTCAVLGSMHTYDLV